MALFKQMRGKRVDLDAQELHDGYAYFCTDDGTFHIDYVDTDGNLQRKQINAQDAETIMGLSPDDIKEDVAPKCATITLRASSWAGDMEPYSQVVAPSNITPNSRIDLQPTIMHFSDMIKYGIALQAVNENGVVTVYAIGGKPTSDYEMQVFITETEVV